MDMQRLATIVPSLRPAAAPAPPAPQSAANDAFGAFVAVLSRRFVLAVVLFAFTLGAAIGLTMITPKKYTTHVKMIAGSSGPADDPSAMGQTTTLPLLNALLAASAAQSSETYAEMVRTPASAALVVKQLHLNVSPDAILANVMVKPLTNTSILDVAVKWRDPVTSAAIANSLAGAFINARHDLIVQQADRAITELNRQIPAAEAKMRQDAAALTAFQARTGIADVQTQTVNAITTENQLDTRLAAAEVDRRQAQASLAVVRAQLARTPHVVPNGGSTQPNPIAEQLRTQLAQNSVALNNAHALYTDENPMVQRLQEEREHILQELARQPATVVAAQTTVTNPLYTQLDGQAAQLGSQIASDDAQIATLSRQRAAAAPKISALPASSQRFADLKRKATFSENVYNALRQKLNDATIAKTTALSDVTVIDEARWYENTVTPKLFVNIAIGIVLGLVVAIVGALIVDYFDGSLKTQDEIESRLGVPMLGSVPELRDPNRAAPWLQRVMVESTFHLATSLRYASSGELRTVAITSATHGEGKSTIALNTALAYAELGPRVLLVDADLRLPSLHQRFGMDRAPGLSDVLAGTATAAEAIRPTKHAGLDVVLSGSPSPNPVRLLQSSSFDDFLAVAREQYAVVVIDATACGAVTDAAAVCTKCDGTVFVASSGETDARVALRAIAKLKAAGVRKVLGAVLNKAAARRSEIGAYGEVAANGARALPLPAHRPRA